jgi:hypothetical protein
VQAVNDAVPPEEEKEEDEKSAPLVDDYGFPLTGNETVPLAWYKEKEDGGLSAEFNEKLREKGDLTAFRLKTSASGFFDFTGPKIIFNRTGRFFTRLFERMANTWKQRPLLFTFLFIVLASIIVPWKMILGQSTV